MAGGPDVTNVENEEMEKALQTEADRSTDATRRVPGSDAGSHRALPSRPCRFTLVDPAQTVYFDARRAWSRFTVGSMERLPLARLQHYRTALYAAQRADSTARARHRDGEGPHVCVRTANRLRTLARPR